MTKREQEILDLIRDDALISQQSIADKLGISRSAVAGHIMKLTNKGIIAGRAYVLSETPFVVSIGAMNMDIHGRPSATLRQHDSNPGRVTMSPGGVARNVAENLVRLGIDCRLVSAVGNDAHGRSLLTHCRDAGIDTRHVRTLDTVPTSTYLSILDRSGDMQVAINDMAIADETGAAQLSAIQATLERATLIIIDTNTSADALTWISDHLQDQVLYVDTVSAAKCKRIKPHLRAVHTLKTNRDEAETLSGLPASNSAERQRVARWFHDRGVVRLFITLGRRGVFYSAGDEQGHGKAPAAGKIQNAGGAGDAFLAGLTYASLQEWSLEESVQFGMAAANVTILDDDSSSTALSYASVNRVFRNRYGT